MRVLATQPTADVLLTATDHEPLRVVASRSISRVVMRRLPKLSLFWAGVGDGQPPKLEWCDAAGEWRDAFSGPFVAPSLGPLSLRAVVPRTDGTRFVLILEPLPVTPGMVADVGVSLTADQLAALRAGAGG